MRKLLLAVVAAIALWAPEAGLAKKVPVDPAGNWFGLEAATLKVKKEGKTVEANEASVTVGEGTWTATDYEDDYSGTYATKGKKYLLAYDAESRATLAAMIASWIEEWAAEGGTIIDVTVTLGTIKSTAKAKNSKKTGETLSVKTMIKFTASATGDLVGTRKGSLKIKGVYGR